MVAESSMASPDPEFAVNSRVDLVLVRNVENAAAVRKSIIHGALGAGITLIKAELILDPTQVQGKPWTISKPNICHFYF